MSASCVTNWKSKLLRGFYSRRVWCSQEERARGEAEPTSPASPVGQTPTKVDTESCAAYITGTVDITSRPDAHFANRIRQQSCVPLFSSFVFLSLYFPSFFPLFLFIYWILSYARCFLYFFRCDDVGGVVWSVVLIEKRSQIREQLKKKADLHNGRLIEYRLM